MIGALKSMVTTMKHALNREAFTVECSDSPPEVSRQFRSVHKLNQGQVCMNNPSDTEVAYE